LKHRDSGRFDHAWGGIASLGLALPVIWTGLQQRSGTFPEQSSSNFDLLTQWLADGPARLAGLTGQKGALAAGYDADIVIFEPDTEWTVNEGDLRFRHKLSPYLGARLRGRVLETYLRGECIYWGRGLSGVIDPKAHGRELRRHSRSESAVELERAV
jgi:allantoinase